MVKNAPKSNKSKGYAKWPKMCQNQPKAKAIAHAKWPKMMCQNRAKATVHAKGQI